MADERSFMVGQSIANQRIEAWWSILRKECAQFWMNLFAELKHEGDFTGNWMDKELLRFCFMQLIQVEFPIRSLTMVIFVSALPDHLRS